MPNFWCPLFKGCYIFIPYYMPIIWCPLFIGCYIYMPYSYAQFCVPIIHRLLHFYSIFIYEAHMLPVIYVNTHYLMHNIIWYLLSCCASFVNQYLYDAHYLSLNICICPLLYFIALAENNAFDWFGMSLKGLSKLANWPPEIQVHLNLKQQCIATGLKKKQPLLSKSSLNGKEVFINFCSASWYHDIMGSYQ